MNKLTETPPVTLSGSPKTEDRYFLREAVQEAFDLWSQAITGHTSDIEKSSHGRAFIAGWIARGDYDA